MDRMRKVGEGVMMVAGVVMATVLTIGLELLGCLVPTVLALLAILLALRGCHGR
jgi:hypothetical protein